MRGRKVKKRVRSGEERRRIKTRGSIAFYT